MKKVVIVSTVGLGYDGITSVIISYLEAMNKKDLKIFVVSTIKSEPEIENRIKKMDVEIIHLPSRKSDTAKYFFSLVSFIKKNRVDVIHAHGNSATLAIELLAGLIGGCKKRIAHSHNTKCERVRADRILRPMFNLLYTDAIACGDAAGKWLFKNDNFIILKNGRDIQKYTFSLERRKEMREKYSIEKNLVIGHVGGFNKQKNHEFLIDIFRKIKETDNDAVLLLVGDGPLRKEIEASVDDIKTNVVFTGSVDNVDDYINAMDCMVLPSLFEGLPLVVIERQINGVPSLLSNNISSECKLTDTVRFESLDNGPQIWASDIIKMIKSSNKMRDSISNSEIIKKKGFDIVDNADILKKIYLS